jgi:hypothetical protein
MRTVLVIIGLLTLIACDSNEPDYNAQDDAICHQSTEPGSEEYNQCRLALRQKRETEAATARTLFQSPALDASALGRH